MKQPHVEINAVEIPVSNLQRALDWYKHALNLECTWSDPGHALLDGISHDGSRRGPPSATRILLVQTADKTRLAFKNSDSGLPHSVVDFKTDDLEGLHAHVRSSGSKVDDVKPPPHDWAPRGFTFEDCEGSRLAAFSYRGVPRRTARQCT